MNKKVLFTALFALLLAPLGIEAKKKVKKEEVPQLLNYPSAKQDEYRMRGGEVVIRGHIVLPEEAIGQKIPEEVIDHFNGRIRVYMRDYIVEKEKLSLIQFKNDGTFSLNLEVPYPMFLTVYPLALVYACPGDTIDFTFDTTKPTREEGVIVDGTGVSGEVSRLVDKIMKTYCDYTSEAYLKVDEQGLDAMLKWKDEQVAKLDDLVRKMNEGLPELEGCSPLASDILRTYILKEYMEYICYPYMVLKKDSIDIPAFWQQYFSFVTPREKYLLDNPLLMIAGSDIFFSRIESTLMRSFNSYGMAIGEVPKRVYNDLQEKLHLSPTNFSTQVYMIRTAFYWMKWFENDDLTEDLANLLPYVSHPELMRCALFNYRDYVKEKYAKVVEEKPLTKGDTIFQRIIEPYKGNVLYVDFWAMWCGPCRGGMLNMRDEVEANKDKPVKYLYITDSTPDECREFFESNNIKGEHIHVTHSEWGYLQEKFQFSGIPFVVLFDKQGKQRENVTIEQLLNE